MNLKTFWDALLKSVGETMGALIRGIFIRADYESPVADEPMNAPKEPPKPPPAPIYRWDTRENARHSVRLICDEMGLSYTPTVLIDGEYHSEKNIITACIRQESNFDNTAVGRNKDKNGKVLSTDWGICQINDYYHVGPGKKWSSVAQIVDNPEKAVRWMITLYKQGQLKLWVSYSSGAYKKWL